LVEESSSSPTQRFSPPLVLNLARGLVSVIEESPASALVLPPLVWNIEQRFISILEECVPNIPVLPPVIWNLD